MNEDLYKEWIEWRIKQKKKPLTNTQAKFAEWLCENAAEQITVIGDLDTIFNSVRRFLKETNKNKKQNERNNFRR